MFWIIGGLAMAAGIPLLIHLSAGSKPEDFPWAAMQFLVDSKARTRWLRLRRWVLMALRMLMLGLLCLALARLHVPFDSRWPLVDGSEFRILLVLDDTASVAAKDSDSGQSCWKYLQDQALETVTRYPSALFAVIRVSKAEAGQWLSAGAARSVVKNMVPTGASGSLPRALGAARATLGESEGNDVVFVFSDQQDSAWPRQDVTASATLAQLTTNTSVSMFGVPGSPPGNVGIVELSGAPYPAVAGKEILLRVRLIHFGENRRCSLGLHVDGQFKATQVVDLRPDTHNPSVLFRHSFDDPGVHRMEVRLDPDEFPADDSRYLALDVADDASVLCVGSEAETSSTAFVRALIASSKDCPFTFGEGGFSASSWPDKTTALITAGVSDIPIAQISPLRRFLEGGGLWLCFLGPQVDVNAYERLAQNGLFPAKLGDSYGSAPSGGKGGAYFQIDALRLAHSMFDCGEVTEFHRAMFSEPRFYRAFAIEPLESSEDSTSSNRVIAWFDNGRNFVVEGRVGNGMIYVFASTADLKWNTLPLTPAFVMVDRALRDWIENGRPQRQRDVGTPLSIDLPGRDWDAELLLPDGTRLPGLEGSSPQTRRWVSADRPGMYEVKLSRKHTESGHLLDTMSECYSFNTEAAESDLRRASWQDIRERYPDFRFVCDEDSSSLYQAADGADEGSRLAEISRLLAMLALCVLVIESLFASNLRGS